VTESVGPARPVEYLDFDDLIRLAGLLLGDPPPVRDAGLLDSAAARPRTTVFGQDAYPDLWSKAAALLQSLVKNHALVDGNKRLAWLATATFLELDGVAISATAGNDDVYRFVVGAAAGDAELDELSVGLRKLAAEHGLVMDLQLETRAGDDATPTGS
jgi:death-on-curing protein